MNEVARTTLPPFLRLGTRTGWQLGPASAPGIVESGGELGLGIAGRSPISATEPFGSFGGRTLPRGLAISSDGRIFLADPERRVILAWQIGDPDTGTDTSPFAPLWPARALGAAASHDVAPPEHPPADPYTLVRPTDVAFSPAGDLVIADPGAGRLLVLAFPTARLRHVVSFPGGTPTAVAFDHQGRAYAADPAAGTVHRYDFSWRRDPTFPHPSVNFEAPEHLAVVRHPDTGTCPPASGGSCGRTCSCGGACGRSDRGPLILVLDRGSVVALDGRGRMATTDGIPDLEPGPLRRGPDGSLLYDDPAGPLLGPIRFTGLALTGDGRHDASGRPLLAVPRRVELPRSGAFTTTAIDGGRPGFAWDRIVFRAEIPANTRLLVRTLAADSGIEFDRVMQLLDDSWSAPLTIGDGDFPELLIQSPAGRYLWLQVELFGDGRATPRISGIDVFGPRRSAVRHLPAGYHQDPESLRFLDRFLSYFDTVFAEVTAANREAAALFDPWAVPDGDALSWLGSWFDLDFLAQWSPDVRRRMIAEAMAYSRERGTVRGLKRILQWHTGLSDPMPQIIEHFRLPAGNPVPIGGELLDPTPLAHGCTIVLPERAVPDDAARARVEQLIAAHAPGHVHCRLRLIPAGVAVGRQSTVGVDTLLGRPSSGALGAARLGDDFATAGQLPRAPFVPGIPRSHPRSQPC